MSKTKNSIPIIDIAGLSEDYIPPHLLEAFYNAYHDFGFGYIINHGINSSLIENVFNASRRFHALNLTEKMKLALDHKHRGYIAINTSTDVKSKIETIKKPNQSASFMIMREDKDEDPNIYLSGPNQWPQINDFREILEEYTAKLQKLANNLLRAALLSAGVKDLSVLQAFEKPTTWLRLLHYPSLPSESPTDLYGSAPHTDFGCLTFLAQDEVGGLQVQSPEGHWLNVPKLENSFVVNVGDMLHRMTNGLLRSTPHRVINRSGAERYSCVFFYDPNVSLNVEPLNGTGAAKFKSLNFGEFLKSELNASYTAHKVS